MSVNESLLTCRTIGPAEVTAGIAFTYSLQVDAWGGEEGEELMGRQANPCLTTI